MTSIPKKNQEEIAAMRRSCALVAKVLDDLEGFVRPGISTNDIDSLVHQQLVAAGAKPATLGYRGYPKSSCTSVNDVICHGIPNPHELLHAGDVVKVDVSCVLDGLFGDSCRTYIVGGETAVDNATRQLVADTYDALWAGVRAVRPGGYTGDIGAAIQQCIREKKRSYGIVREYTGHGVGRAFHEPPTIIHVGKRGTGDRLEPGMTFTVEPMVNLGTEKTVRSRADGWTVRTADGKLSAQWEHTVLVTDDGVEVLTLSARERETGIN